MASADRAGTVNELSRHWAIRCRPCPCAMGCRLASSMQRRSDTPPELRPGGGGYRLDVDPSSIDYHHFRSLISEARTSARPRLAGNGPARPSTR